MTATPSVPPAATAAFELWDSNTPIPDFKTIDEPATLTHTRVERAQQGGYHYLHESSLAFYNGKLYVVYANHPLGEINKLDEVIRGNIAHGPDYLKFGPAQNWIHAPMTGGCSFNHPLIATHQGKLWGFITRWAGYTKEFINSLESFGNICSDTPLPGVKNEEQGTEIFQYDEASNTWKPIGVNIPTFLPFGSPLKLRNGNWLISGESRWRESAVIISEGDDWTRWRLIIIPRGEGMTLRFPETAVIDQGDRLIAVCRPLGRGPAPASQSLDQGETWQPLQPSNYPIADSQPFGGTLSTGEHFLLSNHVTEGRSLLTISLTSPGGRTFNRVLKIRHQQNPVRRVWGGGTWRYGKPDPAHTFVGKNTEWSYPYALEHEGKLYISYTVGKEDCMMSVIPIEALQG